MILRPSSPVSFGFLRLLVALVVVGFSVSACQTSVAKHEWSQWGGPNGDFTASATGLADQWPDEGPERLWQRDFPTGYSALLAANDRLYTMYRDGDDDVIVALNAKDGKTIYEYRYPAPTLEGQKLGYGQGPNATPLLIDGRLIAVGFTGIIHGLNASDGKVLWSHDLVKEFGGRVFEFGYSPSPIPYKGSAITLVGGDRSGVIAFNPKDGSVNWKSGPLDVSYASPIVIHVDGQDQIVFMASTEVVGIDAANGDVEWRHPCENQYKNNCSPPVWGDDNLLWVTTQQDGGTRMLRLARSHGKTSVEEVWKSNKIRLFHWNAIRIGDYIYGTSGDTEPTPLMAIEAGTGKIAWKQRGLTKAKMVLADGKLIAVSENGDVSLVEVSPQAGEIRSTAKLLDEFAWTPPTVVGHTLYLRDKTKIMALNIGK